MKKFNSAISANLDDCEKSSDFFFQINNCGFVSSQSGSEKKYVVARKPRIDHIPT